LWFLYISIKHHSISAGQGKVKGKNDENALLSICSILFKQNIIKENSLVALLNNAVFIFRETKQESWLLKLKFINNSTRF